MAERNVTPGMNIPLTAGTIIIAIVVIVVLIGSFSSFYMVDQTEEAVVLFLGKFSSVTGPGLHFKLPFGIETSYNVRTQAIQSMQFGFRTEKAGINTRYSSGDYSDESIMLTGDLNIVDVLWEIQYRIVDPRAWLFNVQEKEKTIRDVSMFAMNALVGDRSIIDVIGAERTNIEVQAQEMMNKLYDKYGLGIRVSTVKLQDINPPAGPVKAAFEDVNKSIQDMNRLINEGREAYNKAIPQARGEAEQTIQIAKGYSAERVNQARGDVARFLAVLREYQKNPGVTRERLYIEMMEDIFNNAKGTDLIDKGLTNFIPLKNMTGGVQ